jgi:pimeloyl-ACP methyl ester carboxylesterase
VLVDVTPGGDRVRASRIAEFVSGPEAFDTFDEILARTIEFNPGRSVESLRRGILHNAVQRDDGRWVWRHRRSRARPFLLPEATDVTTAGGTDAAAFTLPDYTSLWDDLERIQGPVLLVHGTTDASLVDEAQIAEFRRRQPDGRVVAVEGAGHSVQGDRPLELAALIEDSLAT